MNATSAKKPRYNRFTRHKARELALQALYQWKLSKNTLDDIEIQLLSNNDPRKIDNEFFRELLHQIPAKLDSLDTQIKAFLDRPIDEVSPIELSLLRLGAYELCYRLDIPYKVAINEAVDLAKVYGGEDGHKYINSILDQIARTVRNTEIR